MMQLRVLMMALLVSSTAWGLGTPNEAPVHSFKFVMNNETFEYAQRATRYEEAFDKAAQACFKHFKAGRRVSEDVGLDIIDVCANPRKPKI